MDMLLPVGITLVSLAILLLPYYLAGILCRFWLRQVHAKLVALLCATVLVFAAGLFDLPFEYTSFRTVTELHAKTLAAAQVASEGVAYW